MKLQVLTQKLKKIINAILNKYSDKTVINITHRVENLIPLDKIVVLKDSQIINSGTLMSYQKIINLKNLLA